MTNQRSKTAASYWDLLRLMLRGGHRASRTAAILVAVSAPVLCALFVRGPERWDLFERSGAITTTIGLLLASRRYLRRGIIEIAMVDQNHGSKASMLELVEDIHATKLGMAVSAFGTLIWGAGKYLQWWTFGYLIIWVAIAALDAWRDFVRLRDTSIGVQSEEGVGTAGADK